MSSLTAQCSTGREPWCFYAHLHRPAKAEETEQGHGPAALQLNEVLEQVFSFVDSTTLGSSSSSSGIMRKARAVLSPEQRLAWVTTVGEPSPCMWQCPPLGLPADTAPPPAPLPYPSNRSSSGFSGQLQGWLRGAIAAAAVGVPAASAAAAAAAAGRSVGAAAGSTVAAGGASSGDAGGVSCLATGSSWNEVVQVVDLLEELTCRGLPRQLAAALLDSAGLALGLSVWVAAPHQPHSQQQQDTDQPDTDTAATAAGCEASAAAGAANIAHAQFAAALMLDDGAVPLRSFQSFVRRDSSHHFFSRRLAVAPGGWRRYAYLLPCIPAGCRRAVVLLRGRGPQPCLNSSSSSSSSSSGSSASCGAKFASAQLAFVRQADIAQFGAEACMASWAEQQVARP
ncbi:hypothetical protein OEZ86_008042 [Tetradesmus obliquus]|nr:hypothetical protein OEZ86_008042 [Tetradesmus obliquus]